MNSKFAVPSSLLLLLGSVTALQAEVTVVWDRNEQQAATPAFKFAHVRSPTATDAAVNAKFTLLGGQADANAGEVEVLQDGLLPSDADQPEANFFWAAGTAGGRLLVDLGAVIEVKQISTYSWHTSGRGPQVYRLYASDGLAEGFDPRPAGETEWAKAGWRIVTSVDTRPQTGLPGGQYGVSMADATGAALGRFRYLLFDIARTADGDRFSNTFFSEIDVSDGREHSAPPPEPARYDIVFDTSETPDLADWVATRLRPVCEQWYPKIIDLLDCEGYRPPRRFTIAFRQQMRGVAATSGKHVDCAAHWFRQNLEGEAVGAVVHELVHVAQQYRSAPGAEPNPGWLVEGLADYIRWFRFEPPAQRPHPDPARAKYTDSYRTTAAFLNYVVETHDPQFIKQLHAALRSHTYTPELWTKRTGKTVDELWEAYRKTL